jgi:hypothetical protein
MKKSSIRFELIGAVKKQIEALQRGSPSKSLESTKKEEIFESYVV